MYWMHDGCARMLSAMQRLLLGLVLVSLFGCSSSHVASGDGGRPPLADAAESPVASCGPEGFALRGEGCFCSGPVALYGEVLYRQAIGVEVYDLSEPADPRLVTTVEERAGSEGGLALSDGHLVSVANFAPLHVYSLADPLVPVWVGSLELLASARGIAIDGSLAIVAMDQTDGSALALVDLDNPSAPRLDGEILLDDIFVQGPVRASRGSAWAMGRDRSESSSGRPVLIELELASREVTIRALEDGSRPLSSFDVEEGIAVTVGFEQPLRIYAIEPDTLRELGNLTLGPELPSATSVELRDGRALVAGSGFAIIDLHDPARPRVLGTSPAGGGAWVVSTDTHAYVSSGNGLVPFALGCE